MPKLTISATEIEYEGDVAGASEILRQLAATLDAIFRPKDAQQQPESETP